jgi:hypothetical protein
MMMSVKKYIRKNVYRWHRITSLIVALPIVLWSLSGFLHPVMNSFKPDVKNQLLPVQSIDTSKIQISLQQSLQQNNITSFHNFRIIKLDSNYYYQIQQLNCDTLTYLSCMNGRLLTNGDQLYASYLAQRYLSEPPSVHKRKISPGHQIGADVSNVVLFFHTKPFSKTKITRVELIKKFNSEYKSSAILLPVYRVGFDRKDQIRLYIETSTDRLATAIDNKKAWFIRFFSIAHTWSFLDGMGQTKNLVLGVFSLLCFLTSVFGFYVYNILSKKKTGAKSKSWHRSLGNIFIVTTMLYGVSGAWHAFHKLSQKPEGGIVVDRSRFSTNELNLSIVGLLKKLTPAEKFTNVSVVKIDSVNYWQLFVSDGKVKRIKYINTETLRELPGGDIKYGCYLACLFSNKANHTITHSRCLTQFTNQYSMMNKRLPVIEVDFSNSDECYVETSTGYLSAVVNAHDKAERFSFSNFHMHHYWEHWLADRGTTVQKTILVTSALGLLLLALTGLFIYFRKAYRKWQL